MVISDVKPDAKILDVTAGNRNIWLKNKNPFILWIDIESELEIPPDLVMDCTDTKFPDECVFTLFFDPPHWWGDKIAKNIYNM